MSLNAYNRLNAFRKALQAAPKPEPKPLTEKGKAFKLEVTKILYHINPNRPRWIESVVIREDGKLTLAPTTPGVIPALFTDAELEAAKKACPKTSPLPALEFAIYTGLPVKA